MEKSLNRSSFVFYADWVNTIRELPKDVQLDVYQAIGEYAINGSVIELRPISKAVFSLIKQTIDRDAEKYIKRREINSLNGRLGGAPIGNDNAKNKQKQANSTENNRNKPNDNVNDNVLLIDTNVSINNQDALYFFVAKAFHNLFVSIHGKTKTLQTSSYNVWINTARLILEVDKRPLPQLVAIKLYLEAAKAKEQNTDPFWTETISSINTLRKKNKDGHYYYDMIATKVKKWLTVDGNERKVHSVVEKLNKAVNGGK